MADPLFELLVPYLEQPPDPADTAAATYLARLPTLPLVALESSEQQSLAQSAHSILRALQVLAKRSYRPIVASAEHLAHLKDTLPKIADDAATVHTELPQLESAAQRFATKYSKSTNNAVLDRRRKAMLLARNVDRVSDVLELPTLLSSTISSSTPSQTAGPSASIATTTNYTSALDLFAHIRRLHALYPHSSLISSLTVQAEQEMKTMTTNLIASLQSASLKTPGAIKTISWLRRIAPELDDPWSSKQLGSGEGSLGALFLVCRLACLESLLAALDPWRELADQELEQKAKQLPNSSFGQQTERFLKRYIEIFRDQSFAIMRMYKDIFPSSLPAPNPDHSDFRGHSTMDSADGSIQSIPSALATFPLLLVELLFDTLRTYLSNIADRSTRHALLTQVLYCAGAIGRIGADFSLMIALLEEDLRDAIEEQEREDMEKKDADWIEVMKKHRVHAARLELMASGVGAGRTSSPVDRTVSPAGGR